MFFGGKENRSIETIESDDARHLSLDMAGGYEWWYFDALSDDGSCAVVVIFLLGAPMSPYHYRAGAGKADKPTDWMGVFVTVHERDRPDAKWCQRVYAYNLYTRGNFSETTPSVQIGRSKMLGQSDGSKYQWKLMIEEKAQWLGTVLADLNFTVDLSPKTQNVSHETFSTDLPNEQHWWRCIAPDCRVAGSITLNNRKIAFNGSGYHDHNGGQLPYTDIDIWYWGRAHLDCSDGTKRTVVFYHLRNNDRSEQSLILIAAKDGTTVPQSSLLRFADREKTRIYGLRHSSRLAWETSDGGLHLSVVFETDTTFANGPFYRRLPLRCAVWSRDGWIATGEGIGEIFRPASLNNPIVRTAIWSRLRRRRSTDTAS